MLPQSAIVGAAVRLHRSHARQRLPVSPVCQTANAAHLGRHPLLINFCFSVEHLYRLKGAIDQTGHAVKKSATKQVAMKKQENGRAGDSEKHLLQPAAALRLIAEQ